MKQLFSGIEQHTELEGRGTHEASLINGIALWLGGLSLLLVGEAELKQSSYTELRRQRSEFEAAEEAGICRIGNLRKGSSATMNILDTTEQLYMFYHNKNKYYIFKRKKGGEKSLELHWEFTMNP